MASLSIVIPTLNEQENLQQMALHLQSIASAVEFVVADGGSSDSSREVASGFADQITSSQPGRAIQMNKGASQASGDYVLFLHADTRLPDNFLELFKHWCSTEPDWGFFPIKLDGDHWLLRVIERGISSRSRITGCASGDQAVCIKRSCFESVGGYPELPLMEDVALSNLLSRQCRPKIFPSFVTTSSRRWERHGIVKTVLLMWKIRLSYYLGVSPVTLASWYR